MVASLTLHEAHGEWVTAAIGRGAASGKLSDLRAELRATRAADGDAYEIVHVNGMNERFLAHRERGVEYVTSTKAGAEKSPRTAQAAFAELGVRARTEAVQ